MLARVRGRQSQPERDGDVGGLAVAVDERDDDLHMRPAVGGEVADPGLAERDRHAEGLPGAQAHTSAATEHASLDA